MAGAGNNGIQLSLLAHWRPIVGPNSSTITVVRTSEKDNTCPDPSNTDISMEPMDSSLELDFGPWMLVARQRGRAHGWGGNSRASHVTSSEAVDGHSNDPSPHDTVGRGTCGGIEQEVTVASSLIPPNAQKILKLI